jgi:hypothetical protein
MKIPSVNEDEGREEYQDKRITRLIKENKYSGYGYIERERSRQFKC